MLLVCANIQQRRVERKTLQLLLLCWSNGINYGQYCSLILGRQQTASIPLYNALGRFVCGLICAVLCCIGKLVATDTS